MSKFVFYTMNYKQLTREFMKKYNNPLSWDNKFIYSNNVKVAQINHDEQVIRCLGYFSYDIKIAIKEVANFLLHEEKIYKVIV